MLILYNGVAAKRLKAASLQAILKTTRFYMTNNKLVLSTAGSKEEAHKIARALVERRLAACVNIIPQVESVYRWQGKVEESQEFLLLIKTFGTAFGRVCETIKELHSYQTPECISFSIEDGSLACLKWIDESVR
jgi:periplasmic divalent cation tolerance protein